jgi:hypothetical protein
MAKESCWSLLFSVSTVEEKDAKSGNYVLVLKALLCVFLFFDITLYHFPHSFFLKTLSRDIC